MSKVHELLQTEITCSTSSLHPYTDAMYSQFMASTVLTEKHLHQISRSIFSFALKVLPQVYYSLLQNIDSSTVGSSFRAIFKAAKNTARFHVQVHLLSQHTAVSSRFKYIRVLLGINRIESNRIE
jgi:hypothetical protein